MENTESCKSFIKQIVNEYKGRKGGQMLMAVVISLVYRRAIHSLSVLLCIMLLILYIKYNEVFLSTFISKIIIILL